MEMVPVDPKVLRMHEQRRTFRKVMNSIEQFINSDHDAVELKWEPGEYTSAASVESCYIKAVKRMNVDCVVRMRQGKVYLMRRFTDIYVTD